MKHVIASALLISLVSLAGCFTQEQQRLQIEGAKAHDSKAFADPEYVGATPDGQKVFRVQVKNVPPGCSNCELGTPHWVYFVGTTVSNNQEVQVGKTHRTEVVVTINDKPVDLVEAKTQIDKLITEKQTAELKQLRELQAKYGDQK